MQQYGQVIQFPQAHQPQPQPVQYVNPQNGQLLPPFPLVAAKVDTFAQRVPWYVWLPLGAYIMFRIMRRS